MQCNRFGMNARATHDAHRTSLISVFQPIKLQEKGDFYNGLRFKLILPNKRSIWIAFQILVQVRDEFAIFNWCYLLCQHIIWHKELPIFLFRFIHNDSGVKRYQFRRINTC